MGSNCFYNGKTTLHYGHKQWTCVTYENPYKTGYLRILKLSLSPKTKILSVKGLTTKQPPPNKVTPTEKC